MIPSPQTLATLAMRLQHDFSQQLEEATSATRVSMLPDVLRRCIVTTTICHQTLRALEKAVSAATQERGSLQSAAAEDAGRGGSGSARPADASGPVVIPIGGAGPGSHGVFDRLWRGHLSMAVDRALTAYGEVLRSLDWRLQRQALDSFLSFLSSLEAVGGATEHGRALEPIMTGARKIRAVLEARRQQKAITGNLFRDLESFNIEATAWCYCAMLLAQTLGSGANGSADVRAAVNRVDGMRTDLERPPAQAIPPRAPFDERWQRPPESAK